MQQNKLVSTGSFIAEHIKVAQEGSGQTSGHNTNFATGGNLQLQLYASLPREWGIHAIISSAASSGVTHTKNNPVSTIAVVSKERRNENQFCNGTGGLACQAAAFVPKECFRNHTSLQIHFKENLIDSFGKMDCHL